MTFVAHPRAGILGYFDQYGFDPYGGNPGVGGEPGIASVEIPLNSQVSDFTLFTEQNFTLDLDGIEVFSGKSLEYVRTPTDVGLLNYQLNPSPSDAYDILTRTIPEMDDLAMAQSDSATVWTANSTIGSLLNWGFAHRTRNPDTTERHH